MAPENVADLPYSLLPAGRIDLAPGRAGTTPTGEGVHERRGARAALLLRIGMGGLLGAARGVVALESVAADPHRRLDQAGDLPGDPGLCGKSRPPRPSAAYPPDRARRARRF